MHDKNTESGPDSNLDLLDENLIPKPMNPRVGRKANKITNEQNDMLKSISYDIYLGQDLNLGQDRGQNLHPPNISWIHDVNKTCLLDVTKQFLHKYPNELYSY